MIEYFSRLLDSLPSGAVFKPTKSRNASLRSRAIPGAICSSMEVEESLGRKKDEDSWLLSDDDD